MNSEEIISCLQDRFPEAGIECLIDKGDAVVNVPLERLTELLGTMKDDPNFNFDLFMDITAVDWLERSPRFDVVYHLYSTSHNHRLRIKVKVDDSDPVPSATGLWTAADWMEREVWDMYGIRFSGHPNLIRLLMYEEFKGHPLRRDYPYDKRQPLVEETWPSKDTQVKIDDRGIHRP